MHCRQPEQSRCRRHPLGPGAGLHTEGCKWSQASVSTGPSPAWAMGSRATGSCRNVCSVGSGAPAGTPGIGTNPGKRPAPGCTGLSSEGLWASAKSARYRRRTEGSCQQGLESSGGWSSPGWLEDCASGTRTGGSWSGEIGDHGGWRSGARSAESHACLSASWSRRKCGSITEILGQEDMSLELMQRQSLGCCLQPGYLCSPGGRGRVPKPIT